MCFIRLWVSGVVGQPCLLLTYLSPMTYLVTTDKRGKKGGGRGIGSQRLPGIIFVCTSSLKCNSLRYCKTGGMRAPGIGHLTSRNVHFAGTRTATTADAPSHCSVLAKRCT